MILDKEFYERETVTVAKQLIGKTLTRKIKGKKLSGIITETSKVSLFKLISKAIKISTPE